MPSKDRKRKELKRIADSGTKESYLSRNNEMR